MKQYNSIQQIMKKENGHDRNPIYPSTVIQAVFDAKTGASLEAILAQFNSIYVQYQGSPQSTRNIIPVEMRRAGLMITYMNMDSETITEKASSAVQKDNDHWGLDINWSRVDELSLSGDIAVSAQGTWIINGVDTKVPARGSKGDAGLTPWLKTIDNKLHYSYDNTTWEPCSDYLAGYFRFNATSSDSQAGTIGKIQISKDNKTWNDLSPEFRNYLRIQGYVASTSALPKNQVVGTIYGVNEGTNTYSLHVWDGSTWVNNGTFTSIAAGVVQETGDSETEVMSQKAVSENLADLKSNQGLFLNNKGRSESLVRSGYYDAIVDVNIELKTSADRYYYYLISYISKDQNSAGIYRYDRELNIKEHYMTLSKVEYVGNLVKLYSGANPLSYIVVDYEKLTANPNGLTKDDGVFLNPTVCHYANNYSYTDRLTFVDTPARDGNTESPSGYYRGYTIPLRDLYNKGIRGLLFRGSNHIATSNIVSGLVVDKDGNVSSIVKNPNESRNNGWYTVEIKENDDYFKGTYTTSEEGGEVYTPEVVYLLNEYDFIANNVKKLVFCEKDISAFVVRANGRINYTTGEKISSQGYHYSVDIPKGQYDKLYAYFSNNNTGGEANTGYAFYDSEGAYISGGTFTKRAYNTIDVPSNAVLFKNTALTDPNNTCILKTSSSISYRVELLNQEVGKMKDSASNISDAVVSSVGKDGMRMFVESLSDGEELSAEEFPYCNKVGNQYSVSCKIETFDKVVFAQGYNNYRGFHIEFSKYDVKVYFDSSLKETQTHGLDIKDFLKLNIQHKDSGRFRISLMTNGGNYSFESSFNTYDMNGLLKLISIGSKLSQVKLSATNDRFRCPIWIFGASYEGVSSSRWVGQCKKMGYFNYLLNGLAGRDSSTTAADLNRAMKFGCPKYLYLTIWGNGSVNSLDTTIESVRSTCEEKGITLILTNRPNSLAEDVQNTYVNRKSVIDKYIAMGIRYVDLAEAVSMNESEADGWYDGFLSSDLKHPTELGAKAMAYQVLSDFPEIMQYGIISSNDELGDSIGDN